MRLLVLLLLLANAGFFAWQQGVLTPWLGALDGSQREPERLAQQVYPERLVIEGTPPTIEPLPQAAALPPVEAASMAASAVADVAAMPQTSASTSTMAQAAPTAAGATQCWEAGPYSQEEETQIQTALSRSLPAGSWQIDRFPVPGLWLVYMGPYPDQEALQRKHAELQRIGGIGFEEVRSPVSLRMGFSLGRFNSQTAADSALIAMQTKGVRTARVVSVRPPMDVAVIRVPQADARMQQLLQALPLPSERGFVGCLAP